MDFGIILIYVICYFGLFTTLFFLFTLIENRREITKDYTKKFPKVSIIIPAYNEEKTLFKTVSSLLRLNYPKNKLEIIVVDDGSTDNTLKIAKNFISQGVKVFTKKNEGKGKTLNFGLKKASGELIGCLDGDSFVSRDSLRKMITYFDDPVIMAVTPSLKVYRPKNFLQKIQMIEYLIGIFLRKMFAFLGSIHVTPGPFSLYRKKFFDKYGGYDEDNLTEDIEIALRILSKGYDIENSVDASVYTVAPYKIKGLVKQRLRWYTGFVENVLRHKQLFSAKYGNLGLFVLPGSFFTVLLVIVSFYYFTSKIIRSIIQNFHNFNAIGFDVFRNLDIKVNAFYISLTPAIILTILSILTGIIVVVLAKRLSKEKTSIKVSYIPYMVFYWFFFGFCWILAGVFKIIRKRPVW